MYEDQTVNTIKERMLSNEYLADVDTREGSIAYDATMPAAVELMLLYTGLDYFIQQTFGDTAGREYLVERALERGLTPEEATYASISIETTPATVSVPIGSVFRYDTISYTVTDKLSDGLYKAIADTAGTVGNDVTGSLLPTALISGLSSAKFKELITPGEDEEDTEVFRKRYLASFDEQGYGGNIADYKTKVNAIDGIGGCKIYPVWNGGGTVKIVFMTTECEPPSSTFVDEVQTMIDPVVNQGSGYGIAPVGHHVTVEGCTTATIDIEMTLTASASSEDYVEKIQNIIDTYFFELNAEWPDTKVDTTTAQSNNGSIVRLAQLESRILSLTGIRDVEDLTINGVAKNLELGVNELAVRGTVVCH